jgi:hypothetical protein
MLTIHCIGLCEVSTKKISGELTFNIWIEAVLMPDLPKNSVVGIDNAVFHKI